MTNLNFLPLFRVVLLLPGMVAKVMQTSNFAPHHGGIVIQERGIKLEDWPKKPGLYAIAQLRTARDKMPDQDNSEFRKKRQNSPGQNA